MQPSPVYAQVGFTTPPQINGFFNPDTIYPSQTSRLTINVYNPNPFRLTAVNWIDHLPDDLIVVDPPNPTVTGCGSGYSLTATAGADFISLSGATTLGTIDPATPGICSVTVSVTSFDDGNHTNIIDRDTDGSVIFEGEVVPTLYDDDAFITLLVLPMSNPAVTKGFSPSSISEGGTSQMTITIRNPDPNVALTQVTLHDSLPGGVSVNDTAVTLTNCGAGSTLDPIDVDYTEINLTGATIATGATCTIRVNVKVTGTGTFPNTIHPSDLTNYQHVTIPSNVTANLVVQNIRVDKSYSPTNFQVSTGYSTLSITLTNPSLTNTLTNVHFTDAMDPDVSIDTLIPGAISGVPGSLCSGDVVLDTASDPDNLILNNGVIPAGESCTVTARVRSSVVGAHPNTISCAMITFDGGVAGCASDSATLTVYNTGLGLGVVKSFSDYDIEPGTSTRMTIRITAPGDVSLSNFELTDHLPVGVFVYSTPNATQSGCGGGTFAPLAGDSDIVFTGGTIAAGGVCNLRVNITSSVYGPHTNFIYPADIRNTENRNIATPDDETFTVRDISVTKSFANSIIGRNGVTTLTIQLTNNYSNPLSEVEFTDTLPGTLADGIIIADPPNWTNSCNGMVTANSGTQVIELAGGIIPASQTCAITVEVQGTSTIDPAPTTPYTNRIEIGDVTGLVSGTTFTQNWHIATAGITVGSPDFRINKRFDPILVTGDTASTMTITLVNTESSPVSEIAFTDTLPPHMLLAVPPSPSVGSCGGGVITPAVDRMSFTYQRRRFGRKFAMPVDHSCHDGNHRQLDQHYSGELGDNQTGHDQPRSHQRHPYQPIQCGCNETLQSQSGLAGWGIHCNTRCAEAW